MARPITPHEDPKWTLDDPRYVANYLIDELEYLAFQMKTLMMRMENLEVGIVKLRAMKQNTLINVLLDYIESFDGNVFSASDIFKAVGIQALRTKNKVFAYLSVFVRQGRIYKGPERGTYLKHPQIPDGIL
jgi:hypothetical protein